MFSEIMRYILDLGPTVMLPLVIIVFSKLLGMKLGDCFKSGLHIGIGFVGIGLVIGLMLDSIGPAAKAMAEHFQINLHVIDVGWPGSSPMTWASQIALVAIPVAIGVNVLMLVTRMTRVVNVDIWNIWHMTFTGAMLHLATGSYWLGILGVVVHAAFVYKLGDWFAKDTRDGTVAKLAMRQPFVLFKGLTFQKLCLPGAFRPGDHHNKMLRPGLCVVHASP
ncbi:PTS transporter subunit IIC, partial [Salmonella enterica]|uniref:PTS transporter subunit IIC n=1 Tax=Salmonella enterica TaxID=28901 RepID=UPI003A4C5025